MKTSDFYYDLPKSAIAQSAIEPRHDARLLDTRTMSDHRFLDLSDLLEPGDLVVVNRTRVRRARLIGRKPTGGMVEVLLIRGLGGNRWEALAKPARRLRCGSVIRFGDLETRLVEGPIMGRVIIEADGDLAALAEAAGEIPLPPYFHGVLHDSDRYQTMFADRIGSAAAPTAGLHFTAEVIRRLGESRVALERIELEVSLDTFRPISVAVLDDHEMHSERVSVDPDVVERINGARNDGGRVIAVGTTVVRALETAAADGTLRPITGFTSLFIRPGHRFQAVDLVVTNFHVPGSTLIVLTAAMMGVRWKRVYAVALDRGYRFLSFGDAILVEVQR